MAETSGERPQHQQYQRYVVDDPDHYRIQKQEQLHHVWGHVLTHFNARFDVFNKKSAVKFDQP